jgi:flagellar basal-body rod protein FlgG
MMRALYVAASGMNAQQTRLDTIADNLANANTTGFKRSSASFQDVFYQQMTVGGAGESSPTAASGSGVRLSSLAKDHSASTLTADNDPYHVALNGKGYFVVEDDYGQEFYTRDGALRTDGDGTLMTGTGYRLTGDIRIPDDATGLYIESDGTVSVSLDGDADHLSIGQIEVAQFVNPGGLSAVGGNLYQATSESGDPIYAAPDEMDVQQGYLENSNVDAAEELIELIMAQRAYELNSKVIQAADETMQIAANLRR